MYLNPQQPAMFVFLVSCQIGLVKSCPASEELLAYKIAWSYVDWCKFCIHLSSLKIPPSPYSRGLSKKIIIQTKLVGVCHDLSLYKALFVLSAMVHE
jgi:hypothetical protein